MSLAQAKAQNIAFKILEISKGKPTPERAELFFRSWLRLNRALLGQPVFGQPAHERFESYGG
jgi:hypothetical protein